MNVVAATPGKCFLFFCDRTYNIAGTILINKNANMRKALYNLWPIHGITQLMRKADIEQVLILPVTVWFKHQLLSVRLTKYVHSHETE